MVDELDLLVRNGRLRRQNEKITDIGIRDGRIQVIAEGIDAPAKQTVEAEGNLVTESFVNPHLHLDKVFRCDDR